MNKLHAYDAVALIGKGELVDDIKDRFDLDCSDSDNRRCWRDTTNGAWLFAQSSNSPKVGELQKLVEFVDGAIDAHYEAQAKACA